VGNVGSMADSASHLSSIFVHSASRAGGSLTGPRRVILFSGDKFRNADQSHPLPGHSILSEGGIRLMYMNEIQGEVSYSLEPRVNQAFPL